MATGIYHTTYQGDLALRQTHAEKVRLGLLALALFAAPFYVAPFWLTVLNQIGIAAIAAIGLNLLVGFTGQISLGQGGFLAVGAYTFGIAVTRGGWPLPLALVAAIALTAAVGAFFGLPAIRLKGLYLAISTLAAQVIIIWAVTNWRPVTGGTVEPLRVPRPEVFGFVIRGDFRWYWVIMTFAVLSTLAMTNLVRSSLGRAFMAIRDQDIAASVMGVELAKNKILAFAISSGFVGLAGALTASYRNIVTWERFTLEVSILYLAMIIVGGLGSVSGAIYGAAFMIVVPAYIQGFGRGLSTTGPLGFIARDIPAVQAAVFGLIIILFLIFEPHGLARIWQRTKEYFRLWPFRY